VDQEELLREMLEDDKFDHAATRMTPRQYAKTHGIEPQTIYYYLRGQNPRLKAYRCECGNRLIDVAEADALLKAQKAKRGDEQVGM
jgi:predicted transcriptional regulator